jgi:type II secretory pathway pseudopilin PulG
MILRSCRVVVRSAFTLIEFLIAVAICMILMAGLYFAVDIQTRSTRVGRAVVEEAMLARAVLDLVARDIEPTVTITQPFRFRKGTLFYGTSSSSTDSASNDPATTGASGASGSSSTSSGGASSSTGSSTSGSSSSTASSSEGEDPSSSVVGPALIPPGVVGFPDSLTLYIRRDPRKDEQGELSAGVCRITYGLIPSEESEGEGTGGQGLGRWEVKLALSEMAINPDATPPQDQFELVAPEVKAVRFKYHAGAGGDWVDQWDSRATGSDEVTPQGPPRAIRIEMDLQVGNDAELKTFFRVVQIPVSNTPPLPPPTVTPTTP